MKVILLADIPKVGNRNEVKDLKGGFAQNVLISKGLAVLATPKNLADLEFKKLNMAKKKENENQAFKSLISNINDKKIEIKVKANEKGVLFKSVNAHDVAEAVRKVTKMEIEESTIIMDHIKELGSHTIEIKKGDKRGKFEIEIIAI